MAPIVRAEDAANVRRAVLAFVFGLGLLGWWAVVAHLVAVVRE